MKKIKERKNRKFTDEQILAIRADRYRGMTFEAISLKWECSIAVIMDIVNVKTYRWVQ